MKSAFNMKALIASTVAGLVASGAFAQDMGKTPPGKERCYGISQKGANACFTPNHGCSGLSTKDKDPREWVEVPAGTCIKQGGALAPPK